MRTSVKNATSRHLLVRAAVWLAVLSALFTPCIAEQLPIKTYTTADGLARDGISQIFQDSHGFMWFSTPEGLSRFDGYEFTNYGIEQGLPHQRVNAMLETRGGVYWVATEHGLCRFNPNGVVRKSEAPTDAEQPEGLDRASADSMFVIYHFGMQRAESVKALLEDGAGTVWCGTRGGLYRIEQQGAQWSLRYVELNSDARGERAAITSLLEEGRGALWLGTENGLYRRAADGSTQKYTAVQGLPDNFIRALLLDNARRLWVGTSLGLCEITIDTPGSGSIVQRILTTKDGLPSNIVSALYQTSDGKIWVAVGLSGLVAFDPEAPMNKSRYVSYTDANGLSDRSINALLEDRAGNLWLGTESSGVMKLAHNGLTTYGETDGLLVTRIASIFENQRGALFVQATLLHRFDGRRFSDVAFSLPAGVVLSWGWHQVAFEDHSGEWWLPTNRGLYRFARMEERNGGRPRAVYAQPEGSPTSDVFRIYEDNHRNIWISTLGNSQEALARWERATGKFHRYRMTDGLPESAATAFSEDSAGNLWIGFYGGGLVRFRNDRFEQFTVRDGLPAGMIRGLHTDRHGRLWIAASGGGLGRLDETNAPRPRIVGYTTAEGLASDYVNCVTEDTAGIIYLGTARGLDQLDPETGRIKHYTQKDGLANNYVNVAFRDRSGALWFGTLDGLSRLLPGKERAAAPPNINLRRLSIAGVPYRLSELGAEQVQGLELTASQNQLQIDFVSVGFQPGETLRYQYMLEGADTAWSAATEQRSLTYANLQPGAYRFLVRAISTNGAASERPATIAFKILPPVWRRWWFLTLVLLLAGSVVYALSHRRRVRLKALRESENRFRTLAETASDAIITIDESSTIIFVNAAAENVFGYPVAEMVGADLTMLMPEYLRHLHHAGIGRYVETGHRHISWEAVELPGLHKSGGEIPLELSFGEFTKDDKRYFTGIVRDITERKRAEEALRRTREERLIELERVRKRIARDLHDDIGSSLTQISLLSEVVRQRLDDDDLLMSQPLSTIATSSRELVDSMSDIVWAINPQKDHMSDLVQRMRGLASDVFTHCNMKLRFRAPDTEGNVRLGANLRREVFLVFKEGLNNIVKHSGGTEVDIELRVAPNSLFLSLRDNGRGFDPAEESDGHGLVSMRERIREMGGTLEMTSHAGSGTTITVQVPMTDQV